MELEDLQVGGPAAKESELLTMSDSHILPQLKLERLAQELNQLEVELVELEKSEIPNNFSDENDSAHHLKEIDFLRTEMEKILDS